LFWVCYDRIASQGTTGVLVLARTKALARELSQQFRARAIDKSYLALVVHDGGDARSFFPAKEARGLIDASLSFDDGRVRVQAAASLSGNGNGSGAQQALPVAELGPLAGGKVARTAWEVLASSVSR
jgi:hypothetical protein